MMIVRNEANRYLQEVLTDLSTYVDRIVILDDASTDDTPGICKSFEKVILHRNHESLFFEDESRLRSRLWQYTVETRPGWVLAIDADEIFEKRMQSESKSLINQDEFDVVEFRLFDFWGGRTHYRVDGKWDPWVKGVRMLFRYHPNRAYSWPEQRFHCGRVPVEVRNDIWVYQSDLRVKHFGWARDEDIRRKYDRYKQVHQDSHLESVLADPEDIELEKWIPGKVLPF